MNPFFIENLPADAEYADNSTFFHVTKQDFYQHIQMIDLVWSTEKLRRINNIAPNGKWARHFDIKDVQMSPVDCEILCSICFFKREAEVNHRPFGFYVDALKAKVERFAQTDYARQKLRVYVGDSAWDVVHKEKILDAKHVDFVRMRSSSGHSILGMQWRLLAYDDYSYPCVYMNDTHYDGLEMPDEQLENRFPKDLWDSFNLSLTSAMPYHDSFLTLHDIRNFERDNFVSHYFFVYSPLTYLQAFGMSILRGPQRLPFANIVSIVAACYEERGNLHTLYDPRHRLWTEVGELRFWMEWVCMLGFWIYFLRKHITFRYHYLEDYHKLLNSVDQEHFFRRLHHQVFDEKGHLCF